MPAPSHHHAPGTGWCLFATPVGDCALAWNADGEVVGCWLPETAGGEALRRRVQRRHPDLPEGDPPAAMHRVIERVNAALRGTPDTLEDVVLDQRAVPPFHRRVYAAARRLGPGQTCRYGDLAQQLGEPGSARAIGQALGQNPFAPIVPCHRVLAAGGRPGGFSAPGGLATKLALLELEGARFGDQDGLF